MGIINHRRIAGWICQSWKHSPYLDNKFKYLQVHPIARTLEMGAMV